MRNQNSKRIDNIGTKKHKPEFEKDQMKKLTFIFSLVIIGLTLQAQSNNEQIILNRIEYIYSLKSLIDKNIWNGFSENKYDVPLVYYTDSSCYTVNPTLSFIDSFNPNLVFNSKGLKIFKTILLDSIPFHMSASVILGDSTSDYNYRIPYLKCSSFEITKNTIPDVNSTEEWVTMIIHEYFHGFQYKHEVYLDYFEQKVAHIPADSLKKIYRNNSWFKENVDMENEFLLSAIASNDKEEASTFIDSFLQLREKRRLLTLDSLNFDISDIEQAYETMEGTARYVEYSLYNQFAMLHENEKLLMSDTSFQSYEKFKNYDFENDQWLFQTRKTTYFYATGFNIARLLDKLGIEYKTKLFKESGLSLEQILKSGM